MRVATLGMAVLAFAVVAVVHVQSRAQGTELVYGLGRGHDYAERLERRLDVIEARVRAKYSPVRVRAVVTEIRKRRSGESVLVDV